MSNTSHDENKSSFEPPSENGSMKSQQQKTNKNGWQCDVCKVYNELKREKCKKCNIRSICFTVQCLLYRGSRNLDKEWSVRISYDDSITYEYLLNKIEKVINADFYPEIHIIDEFNGVWIYDHTTTSWFSWGNKITDDDVDTIKKEGFSVETRIQVPHKIINDGITCEYIKNNNEFKSNDDEFNPIKCPIYKAMKIGYSFTEKNLNHLVKYTHFRDEYNEKPVCKYNIKCKAFIRLENGGNRLDDKCHIKIYRHPPRNNRQV
eukprot:205289_1